MRSRTPFAAEADHERKLEQMEAEAWQRLVTEFDAEDRDQMGLAETLYGVAVYYDGEFMFDLDAPQSRADRMRDTAPW